MLGDIYSFLAVLLHFFTQHWKLLNKCFTTLYQNWHMLWYTKFFNWNYFAVAKNHDMIYYLTRGGGWIYYLTRGEGWIFYLTRGGGWMICHFSIIQVHFVFCSLNFITLFLYLIKYYNIMFIIIVFWLECDRPSGLIFFVSALLLSILMPPFLPSSSVYLISFLLFTCASVWENTLAWVPHFQSPYWIVLAFFSRHNFNLMILMPFKN